MSKTRVLKRLEKKINKSNDTEVPVNPEMLPIIRQAIKKINWHEPINTFMIKMVPPEVWRLGLGATGNFQLITWELVDFLRHLIKGKRAIEICAGNGTLGKYLKIPTTDRYMINHPEASQIFKIKESEFSKYTRPPEFVEELSAAQAIEKYNPDIVIGCWVSHKVYSNKKPGSKYGVEEEKIIDRVETYVHCGNDNISMHAAKRILKNKHWTITADWLYDRASNKGPSQMKIWTAEEPDWDAFPENLEFNIEHN